jgi:hypothetical protein
MKNLTPSTNRSKTSTWALLPVGLGILSIAAAPELGAAALIIGVVMTVISGGMAFHWFGKL